MHAAATPTERTLELRRRTRAIGPNADAFGDPIGLPARSIDETRLAEDVAAGGRPICNARARAT